MSVPTALSVLQAQLIAPHGRARIDALLEAADPVAAVAELESGEIHALVHEVGFEEAGELLALANGAQFQGCFDLDGWDRDKPDVGSLTPWIAALIETGYEHVGEVWAGLDAEVRALILQRGTIIHDLTLGEEPDDTDDRALYITVDRFFGVRLTGSDDDDRLVVQLIDDLYRADSDLARNTLQAARSELGAELEEEAYRWRCARLADAGYPELGEALNIYRSLEPGAIVLPDETPVVAAAAEPMPLAPAIAAQVAARDRLAAAMAVMPAESAQALMTAFVVLINKVLAAGRVSPADRAVVERGGDYASATVALGLDILAGADDALAARHLARTPLERIFRVGYTRTTHLARVAAALAARVATAGSPAVEVVAGLGATRPLLARAALPTAGTGFRPFECNTDVRLAGDVLTRLTLRVALAEDLGVNVAAMATMPEPRPGLDDHARTAAVRLLGRGEWRADALTQAELMTMRDAAMTDGRLRPEARLEVRSMVLRRLDSAGLGAHPALGERVAHALADDLEAALGSLGPGPVDPRFVSGLLVATR